MKRALIVGGANGIGLSIATELTKIDECEKIYIVDNDELERQLADAVSLVRNGNKLHISSLK